MIKETVYQFGKEGKDQRLCHRSDGVYVFDWSGESPETTDDGPLLVLPNSTCCLHIFGGSLEVSVPVQSKRDGEMYRCSMSLRCFEKLTTLVPGLTLSRSKEYSALAQIILKAEAKAFQLESKE